VHPPRGSLGVVGTQDASDDHVEPLLDSLNFVRAHLAPLVPVRSGLNPGADIR